MRQGHEESDSPLVEPLTISVRAAADALGYTASQVYRLIREGYIPAGRFGRGQMRIPVDGLKQAVRDMAPVAKTRVKPR
jgi:excisionase family DNA binding protein